MRRFLMAVGLLLFHTSFAFAYSDGPSQQEIEAVYAQKLPFEAAEHWSQKTKELYSTLRNEQISFVDLEASLYNVAYSPDQYDSARFAANLKTLAKTGAPKVSEIEYKKLDTELNSAFKQSLKGFADGKAETQLRGVEAQWIKYRDAWSAFGISLFPKSHKHDWLAAITLQRVEHIRKIDINGP